MQTGELPHKLAYFTTGANAWFDISSDVTYSLGNRELNTLQQFISKTFSQERPKRNVYHIGSGNGKEIPEIINTLSPEKIEKYILIDISPELLHAAENICRKKYEKINFSSEICDIIDNDLSAARIKHSPKDEKNLFLLVANGAILSNPSVLTNIRKSMKADDLLVITLSLVFEEEEMKKELQIDSVVNLLVEPLRLLNIKNVQFKHLD